MKRTAYLCLIVIALGMGTPPTVIAADSDEIDVIGHRGARGVLPENTLPAFAHALAAGVDALELDVGLSRDGVVVVAHDRSPHPAFTRDASGEWLSPDQARPLITYDYEELRKFDVGRLKPGSKYAGRFPDQQPVDGTPMPTLQEVIALARKAGNDTVRFDVELKRNPDKPEETRDPEPFARAVLDVLRKEGVLGRAVIQSFDWSVLAAVKKLAPEVPRSYLTAQFRSLNTIQKGRPDTSAWTGGLDIDDYGGSVPQLVKAAGGTIWSAYHLTLNAKVVREARALGLTIYAWTVNTPEDLHRMVDLQVDGIITDYPKHLRAVLTVRGYKLPKPTPVE